MSEECVILDTNLIKKGDKTYYIVLCYLPQQKDTVHFFVDKDTYDYCADLPYYEDISSITHLVYDRKIKAFKLSINVDKI